MAAAPQAIWNLWYAIRDQWKGAGQQDEMLSGIVGDRAHSFGFHLAPSELPTSDYSLRTLRDRRGAALYPNDASALDVHFGPDGMVTATKRLIASAKDPDDPRLDGLYEFCGTTNGTSPHPFTVDTGSDDPNNTQGWDDSHVTHVHLSIHRDVSHNFAALKGIADVIAGVPANTDLGEEMALSDEAIAQIRSVVYEELGKYTQQYDPVAKKWDRGRHQIATLIATQLARYGLTGIRAEVDAIKKDMSA